jgi:hypothetical protein
MRSMLTAALLFAAASSAQAYTWRDNPSTRFENDIRANSESLRARHSDNRNHIAPQNSRLRERLHGLDRSHRFGPRLRR